MDKDEKLIFDKVIHRKLMFDDGSAKIKIKSKNSSKVLPLTKGNKDR